MLLVRRLKLTPGSTRLPKSLQLRTCNSSRRLRSVLLCQAGAGGCPALDAHGIQVRHAILRHQYVNAGAALARGQARAGQQAGEASDTE